MAQAVVLASPPTAEARLAQVVSEFESKLPSERKRIFKQEATTPGHPSLADVMRTSVAIDQELFKKHGIRSSYGPYYTSFLEGLQKFVPLGDTLIGGTTGWVGRGVWTAVRFTILVGTGAGIQSALYASKMSKLFMEIGRTVPRHEHIASLFPQSQTLRDNLAEYYIVIVQVCIKIADAARSGALKALWDSFSDPFVTFETELAALAKIIEHELTLHAYALIKSEAQENAKSRALSLKDRNEKETRRKESQRIQILDKCTKFKHKIRWKQLRRKGIATIHIDDNLYETWKVNKQSSTHVISGRLGSGKSVLLANIVEDLYTSLKPGKQHILYFFCHHRVKESLIARTIFGSIVRQLLETQSDITPFEYLLGRDLIDVLDLVDVYNAFLRRSPLPVVLVLDGLDECSHREIELMLQTMGKLLGITNMRLCVSCRWEPEKKRKLQLRWLNSISEPTFSFMPEDNPDIRAFVDQEMDRCLTSGALIVNDHLFKSAIKRVLNIRSGGMFLWVSLAIKAICGLPEDKDVLRALLEVPLKLEEVYLRLLDKCPKAYKGHQKRVLLLTSVAVRPLTVMEMREALSVEVGDFIWHPITPDLATILACCGGLVVVEDEDDTIEFAHDSIRQFLIHDAETGNIDRTSHHFTEGQAEKEMAQVVATYLNYPALDTRVAAKAKSKMPAQPIVSNILAAMPGGFLGQFAHRRAKPRTKAEVEIGHVLLDVVSQWNLEPFEQMHFAAYAKQFWFQHCAAALEDDELSVSLVRKLIEKDLKIVFDEQSVEQCALLWAMDRDYTKACEILLGMNNIPKDTRAVGHSLCLAADRGSTALLQVFLKNPRIVSSIKALAGGQGSSLCLWQAAAGNSQYAVVRQLLESNILSDDTICETRKVIPLHGLSNSYVYNDAEIARLVVADCFSNKYRAEEFGLGLPNGHSELDFLKKTCGYPYSQIEHFPIELAARYGWVQEITLILIHPDIDVNRTNSDGDSPLLVAVKHNHVKAVKALLSCPNVDPNFARSSDGFCALHIAAELGLHSIIDLLLANGSARLDRITRADDDALMVAIKRDHEEIACELVRKILARSEAEMNPALRNCLVAKNIADRRGPLSYAAEAGMDILIAILLKAKGLNFDIFEYDLHEKYPMQYAVKFRRFGVVDTMIAILGEDCAARFIERDPEEWKWYSHDRQLSRPRKPESKDSQ